MSQIGKQDSVALLLASGQSVRAAATASNLSERTIHRWLATADFRTKVAALRSDLFDQAVGQLADLAGKAASTLGALLGSQSETTRLRAATSVLSLGPPLRDNTELAQRIDQLETRIHERAKQT